MLRRPFDRLRAWILLHPGRVLVLAALLVVLALVGGSRVEFRSSRAELAPPDDPDQQRWESLLKEYRGSEALIVCVERAEDASVSDAELTAFVDRLAGDLALDPLTERVFHRLDVDWLRRHAIYLLPSNLLSTVLRTLDDEPGLLERLRSVNTLADLNRLVASRIELGLAEASSPRRGGAEELSRLAELIDAERRLLADPEAETARLASWDWAAAIADGHVTTRDGQTYFVIVVPVDAEDGLAVRRNFVRTMGGRVDRLLASAPGIRVAFTGQPALVVEEMDTVRRDAWNSAAVAIVGVGLLTMLVFRWRSHAVLVLVALGVGVAWAFGAVLLELGYLNMITSSFLSTLIGVGVAYGIHPVSEYELEGAHTRSPIVAASRAFERTGPGVTVAATTTAVAFLSIRLMQFRGFAELGVVAGVGVVLCWVAASFVLPALIVVYGRYRHGRSRAVRRRAAVDRFWVEKIAAHVCRSPRAVVAAAVALSAVCLLALPGLRFDTNILELMPRNAESLRYQRKMILESDLSPLFDIVVTDRIEELRAMERRAAVEPTIQRFDSILHFLPRDEAAAGDLIGRLKGVLDGWSGPAAVGPLDREDLVVSLERLEEALASAVEVAFTAGMADLVGPLEEARGAAESCLAEARQAPESRAAAWSRSQAELARRVSGGVEWLRTATEASPPTLASIPAELRGRFVTASGRLLGMLVPAIDLFDADELEEFVAASRRVDSDATGFPIVFHKMSGRITAGFYRAVVLGVVMVLVILLIDFRHLGHALIALAPLAMGVLWTLGSMRLLGLSFNFANLVAIPLIIGVGIDNGVHVVHRVRLEGREGMGVVLRHTGRAILIASLTTMVGFGSLALAAHQGMASLGTVLLLGVGACLVTSTVVLPNLLVLLGIVRR